MRTRRPLPSPRLLACSSSRPTACASPRPTACASPRLAALLALVAACSGDSGSSDTAASASGTGLTTTTTTTTDTTAAATESGTTTTTTGGESESATESTTTTTTTTSTTDETSGTSTTGDMSCVDTPPPGFDGPMDAACKAEPEIGMFNPVVEWKKSAWAVNPSSSNVMMMPIVASLNDDDQSGSIDDGDIPDLLLITADSGQDGPGTVRAMSGDGSVEHWNLPGQLCATSGLAAGDIDGDGIVEIVGITDTFYIRAFEHDGAVKWTTAASYQGDMSFCYSAPAIADMEGDGKPEIIVGRVILNNDGTLKGKGAYGTGAASFSSASFAADIDGDGVQEVVVGNALYKPDGSTIWYNNLSDGYPAVADFDADGKPEIVVAGLGAVRLQNAGGGTIWSVPNPSQAGGPPTIADFDGDGEPEIGVAGKTAYTVFDGDGSVLWTQPTTDFSSAATGSSVYDFEGDGVADVVYADEVNLYVYSGKDGTIKLNYAEHNNATIIEYPLVVDVDNDGQVEIIVVHWAYMGNETGVTVLGDMNKSWRPGRKIWNQHAYNITNVTDAGGIPAKPEANWLKYNNFRSGDLSPNDGAAAPDLKVKASVCEFSCSDSQLLMWVQLGNEGASPLTAGATIEVRGKQGMNEVLITSLPYVEILDPGTYTEGIAFNVDNPADYDALLVRAIAGEAECNEGADDDVVIEPPYCGIPG
ncbi:MAG: VCBS repeat-containing protein [Nannocystaceae bacterium]